MSIKLRNQKIEDMTLTLLIGLIFMMIGSMFDYWDAGKGAILAVMINWIIFIYRNDLLDPDDMTTIQNIFVIIIVYALLISFGIMTTVCIYIFFSVQPENLFMLSWIITVLQASVILVFFPEYLLDPEGSLRDGHVEPEKAKR